MRILLFLEYLNTLLENLLFTVLGFYFIVELIGLFSIFSKIHINPLKLLLLMSASIVTGYPDSKTIYIFRISEHLAWKPTMYFSRLTLYRWDNWIFLDAVENRYKCVKTAIIYWCFYHHRLSWYQNDIHI